MLSSLERSYLIYLKLYLLLIAQMTGSNILAETFGKFWITNIHSPGSVEEKRIIGLPGLQI
jgi:hypothetical protein